MTMDIKMLKAIADAALEMAMAMQAVVDDCAEQLAQRKAVGEAGETAWQEPNAGVEGISGSRQEAGQGAQSAPAGKGTNMCTEEVSAQDGFQHESEEVAKKETRDVPESRETGISIVELRAFVAERSTPENRPLIKEILNRFGVKKLTELKEEQYYSVLEAVRKECK